MTFDVGQLPGRAAELKQAGIDAAYREMTRFGAGGQGGGYSSLYAAAEKYMEGVESIYDDFLDIPAPEDFAGQVQSLASAMGKLATEGQTNDPVTNSQSVSGHNPNLSKIGSSGDLLDSWTGDAAFTYNRNFADAFEPTASSQYAAVSVLRNAINAEAAVWAGVRDDLDRLSQDAIEVMKEAGNKGGNDWAAVLSIAAAVIAVPVTGGASAIAIPAVAAGLSIAATGISAASGGSGPDELGLDGGSSDKVISSLQKALTRIKEHIVTGEQEIVNAMNGSCSALDDNWRVFCLPEPAITDAKHHPVNDQTMAGHDA
ncbi:hypothetical protein FB382_004148 [Nocardioides ginsengisegetis]|uniref:Uncharacterized protein n=1 Tax=Nocardioides ginsengisegetis TaxID=661491 RepID=A0A7W3J3T8_9ACTN|nr:hypothetical protein [Nocardioides ginsengisegetis]MBA8805803.1 hypothetical protein [Nocardioides ginsengisegetis]